MTTRYLAVSEIFGPTLQGEGPSIGTPATFLRTAGCNLACVWCDTAYTWDWKRFDKASEVHRLDLVTVESLLETHRPVTTGPVSPLVVLTGGEPLLQQDPLVDLFDQAVLPWRVEVETAGTIIPTPGLVDVVSLFVVSPKLRHSGNNMAKARNGLALRALSDTGRVAWKFVCQTPSDVDEAADVVELFDLSGPVWIMPEGRSVYGLEERTRVLTQSVLDHGFRLTPRLHVAIWGDTRGH